jgi:hypothetical protein
MTTALQLVTSALRKIGAVAAGEAPDANEQVGCAGSAEPDYRKLESARAALYRLENASIHACSESADIHHRQRRKLRRRAADYAEWRIRDAGRNRLPAGGR